MVIIILLLKFLSCTQSNPTPKQRLRLLCFRRNIIDLCVAPNSCSLSFPNIDQICADYTNKRRSGTISSPSEFATTTLPHVTTSTRYNKLSTNVITLATPLTKDPTEVPVISKYPRNATVKIGSNLNLKCEADDGAVVAIVKDTGVHSLSDLGSIEDSGLSKTVKKLSKLTLKDSGRYKCIARNSGGISYADFHITVLDLCEGIQCIAPKRCVGDYKNGTATCECPNYCRKQKKNRYNVVCGNNCVNYFTLCHLRNAECLLGSTIGIFQEGYCPPVYYPRLNLPKEHIGTISESVTLVCDVVSTHSFYIKWYRINSTVILSNKTILTILNAQKEDEGEYICEVKMCSTTVGAVTRLVLLYYRPPAICISVGGSHIRTFDSYNYSFDGYGHYVMAMDCTKNAWHVYGRFKPCGLNISCLSSITVYYKRKALSLYRQFHILSKDMWEKLEIGANFNKDGMIISFDGSIAVVELGTTGVKVVWDGMMTGAIFLSSEQGITCGICGNHDNNDSNDIVPRATKNVRKYETDPLRSFISSWMIGKWGYVQNSARNSNTMSNCTEDNAEVCKNTLVRLTTGSKCVVDLDYYIKVCLYDVCQMKINWSSIDAACYVASVMSIECSLRSHPVDLEIEKSIVCRDRANFNNKINVYT